MADIDKTIFACQTFVIVVPTWLVIFLAGVAIGSAIIKGVEVYYIRKFHTARPASPNLGKGTAE